MPVLGQRVLRGERKKRDLRSDLRIGTQTQGLCLHADRVASGWQGRALTARNIISGPFPARVETRGNSESSVRPRSSSLRTGAGERETRRGQVGSWRPLWTSRACWAQWGPLPKALPHHREGEGGAGRGWEEGKGRTNTCPAPPFCHAWSWVVYLGYLANAHSKF